MLILTRPINRDIVITVSPSTTSTRMTIKVCDVRGDKARIGIDAPPEVTINRKEIQDLIDQGKGYTQ